MRVDICLRTRDEILSAAEAQLRNAYVERAFPGVTSIALTIYGKLREAPLGLTTPALAMRMNMRPADVRRHCEVLAYALLVYASDTLDHRVRVVKEVARGYRNPGMPARRYRLDVQRAAG
jgi:hypothetical protein